MKTFVKILLIVSLFYSCKNDKKETVKTSEKETAAIKYTPKLMNEVEGLTHAESVVYDKKRNVLYVSLIGDREKGDGGIAKMSLDGNRINRRFISGLNDPKGIAVSGDKLYVSDVKDLVEIDLNTGKIVKNYTHKNTAFLNDVEIGKDGTVYVSDTSKSSIFALTTDGTFSEWIQNDNLEHPNGLLLVDNTMYVAAWGNVVGEGEKAKQSGNFLKLNMETKAIAKVSKDTLGNLDGAQIYDKNTFLISAWNTGRIMKINTNGDAETILTVGRSVGDILYIPEKKLLALPMNIQSKLLIYEFQEVK
jgi:sugar lactone lactonase YvrE